MGFEQALPPPVWTIPIGAVFSMIFGGIALFFAQKPAWKKLTNVITQTFSPQDRSLITNALPNGTPLTPGEFAQLSPQAQAAYQLLTGSAPDKVDQNIAALSPSKLIDRIRAPFFLLHDRNDTSVPFTESRAFAAALTCLHHPYEYVEFHIFDHVEVRSNLALNQELTDGSHLFDILTRLLLADS
jgi:hypothetical protein